MAPENLLGAFRRNPLLALGVVVAIGGAITVAGLGAGVLESSTDEHPGHVNNKLVVVSGVANVTENSTVDHVNVTVRRGTRDVNLSTTTIEWLGPHAAKNLVLGTETGTNSVAPGESRYFRLVPLRDSDDSAPEMNDQADRFKLVINATAVSGHRLSAGDEVQLKLITSRRAVTRFIVTIPESLDANRTVEV